MLFEAEIRLTRKAVRIRDQGTEKALDFVLHIALPGGATQARGARATFAVLHASPSYFPRRSVGTQRLRIDLVIRGDE